MSLLERLFALKRVKSKKKKSSLEYSTSAVQRIYTSNKRVFSIVQDVMYLSRWFPQVAKDQVVKWTFGRRSQVSCVWATTGVEL